MLLRLVVSWMLTSFLVAPVALAQPFTFDGCHDYYGRPVMSVPNDRLPDVARAFVAPNGQPVIEYNRYVLSSLSPQSRLFWYGHECGHHALGHNFGTSHPLSVEQEADCFGIVTLVEEGYLDLGDIRIIQREISRSPGDWTHLPGPRRAVNLGRCLEEAGLTDRRGTRRANSCEYAYDGECDEPTLCRRGTDSADCPGSGGGRDDGDRRPPPRLYCCDSYGNRYCPIVVNPGPVGSACGCSGLPGWGVICR